MPFVKRRAGIRPGTTRAGSDFDTQLAEFEDALGQVSGPAGDVNKDNFSPFAGIRETKIDFNPSTGHDHDLGGSNTGAELAHNSISDLQISWSSTDQPRYTRGAQPGMVVRWGFWNDEKADGSQNVILYGGGFDLAAESFVDPIVTRYRVHFGNQYDTTTTTVDEGGSPFPEGSSPVVLITPIVDIDIVSNTATGMLEALLRAISNTEASFPSSSFTLSEAMGEVCVSIVNVTHEFFDFEFYVPSKNSYSWASATAFPRYVANLYGINWIAIYDPTIEGVF